MGTRGTFQIGEPADRSGTTRDAIRYYESVGVLPQPRRSGNGYRIYGSEDVERLQFVHQVQVGRFPNPLHAVEDALRPLLGAQAETRREHPFLGHTLVDGQTGQDGPRSPASGQQRVRSRPTFVVSGLGAALGGVGVMALTLAFLTFGLAWLAASAQTGVVAQLRAGAPTVERWGGALLVLVGTWILSLAVFAEFFVGTFPP